MFSSQTVLAHLTALLPAVSTPPASPTTSAATSSGSGWSSLIFLVLIAVVAYFLLIRPQRNRARQAERMRAGIAPGVEVLTRHGQHARVVAVNDDGTVTLEIAPGVHSRFVKEAVGQVLTPAEPETGPPDLESIPDEPATDEAEQAPHRDDS